MEYPILRSGFVTFTMKGLRQPNQPVDSLQMAILGKERLTPDNDNFYHENCQKLYVRSIKEAHQNVCGDLEFQEDILQAAAEAFGKGDGTGNFFDWVQIQDSNPNFTAIHRKFIIETCDFIMGKPRQMWVPQWIKLLEAGTSESRTALRDRDNSYYKKIEEYRKDKVLPHKLSQLLYDWMRQENGVYDLVTSLEVIFGNRNKLSAN